MPNTPYSVKQLMETAACTGCRVCLDVCPAVSASRDGELSALFRLKGLNRMLRRRAGVLQKLFARIGASEAQQGRFSDTVFRCTLCGNCQEACPVGIHLKDLWFSLRHDMVQSRVYPKRIDMIRDNLQGSRNVFDEDNEERADWVEDLQDAPDHGYLKDQAEVVYFTGCVASYFPLAQKIPIALAEILEKSGVDFTLLGEEEWCCGFPLLGAGLKDLFDEFMTHNLAAVKAKGAKKLIFACPSCYQTWREYYPREVDISHGARFLLELVRENHVPFKHLPMTVTYHDPCDLGRGARVFEEPRELIRAIPGVRLLELPRNREACTCCGGGGNLEMIDPELSKKIADNKIKEIIGTGAQAVVTACQQCVRTMTATVRRNKVPLEVLDIVQLVRKAIEP